MDRAQVEPADRPLHVPVLVDAAIGMLRPRAGGRYLDGTLGLGGHAEALLEIEGTEVCGLDRDPEALARARERLGRYGGRFHCSRGRFGEFAAALAELGWNKVDGALLDIGVSSLQLDRAERGFSHTRNGPLDMRMDAESGGPSARDWVNGKTRDELRECLATLGEEPLAGRIAKAIVEARGEGPIETTAELAAIVERCYPRQWRAKGGRHPATRTFQALRMAVNDELGELRRFLDGVLPHLPVGGRLCVITFHSLEDRLVKRTIAKWAAGCRCPRGAPRCVCSHVPEVNVLTKRPLQADVDELARNPRASSAKLRAVEKIAEARP
ncbi:MAG: 16S rRNA (cytosine(1402)-N(4))-methyltransferase RsmH [Desulfovibrio sp.]|jgi:16S rRNA (cytosine1402-N4)-methyltransferase|nr:16S rRNA (cytosine(1402)-N(4))-methyltransferase RsmH [Desulfovibrio sp.]